MSESAYQNIVNEAKRVLLPGGYLEMAILDLDMLNMGNRTRRAVRSLKVQLQHINPAMNLASASDLALKCVARRGFEDVKSCNVGIPVASTISPLPSDESIKNSKDRWPGDVEEEPSLADLIKDSSIGGDESITKLVAKVGRWWFTRCYESTSGNMSTIFNDVTILNECKKWNSSFKLMVAHARKPIASRRRGASV